MEFVPLIIREISLGPSTIETEKCMAMLKRIDGDQCHLFSQSNWVLSNQR